MNTLTDRLQTLQSLDLIKSEEVNAQLEYAFKHVFTQESVYGSLLRSDRRQLHRLVGEALEQALADGADEVAVRLAHHFGEADDSERALKYLRMAARNASRAYANEEAQTLYTRILALLDDQAYAERWDTRAELEAIHDRLGLRNQQADDLSRLQTLADLLQDPARLTKTHQRRAVYFDRISDYQQSAQSAQSALNLAQQIEDPTLIARSFNLLAQAAWRRFQYEAVQDWANQALDALRVVSVPAIRVTSLLHLGRASYRLGQYDAALDYTQAALKLAHETDNRPSEAVSYLILGWIYQRLGDYDKAEAQYQRDLEIRCKIGDRYGEAEALSHLGWVAYDQGAYARGLQYGQDALGISRLIGNKENEAYAISGIGLAQEGLGEATEAIASYQEALTLHRAINAQTLVIFDLSRLAGLALDMDDAETALGYVKEITAWTGTHDIEQFWDPWLIQYTVYRVLAANQQHTEANTVLNDAYSLLQTRADRISDTGLRHCFLEKVPVNRLIAEAWRDKL